MSRIVVTDCRKNYRISRRASGFWGACRGLVHRRIEEVAALRGIDCQIESGELVGLLGPNGAGKSTLVKILAGILVPDGGQVLVDGRVPWQERKRHVDRIGVVFGQRSQLAWDLPVRETFTLLRAIYAVDPVDFRRRHDELVAALAIDDLLDRPVRQLSLGQRMRCDLVAALLHGPDLLFLDEPTIGLDAPAKLAMRAFLRRCHQEHGTTVLLTTHDMDDVAALCQRVLVINHGQLLFDGDLASLRSRHDQQRRLLVDFTEPVAAGALPAGVERRVVGPRRWELTVPTARMTPGAAIAWLSGQGAIADLHVESEAIDEVIARLYRAPATEVT